MLALLSAPIAAGWIALASFPGRPHDSAMNRSAPRCARQACANMLRKELRCETKITTLRLDINGTIQRTTRASCGAWVISGCFSLKYRRSEESSSSGYPAGRCSSWIWFEMSKSLILLA